MAMIYRANVASLRHYGLTMSREWFREQYTPDWRRGYQELGIPEHLWDEMAGRWAEEMARMRPRAMPWARRALRDLRRHGVQVGLVTASTRGVVEPNIERLNLAGVFETAWYSDDVERSKPHPEALLRALDDLGVAAADTVYVGDTIVDLEMALAAGAAFAAVGDHDVARGIPGRGRGPRCGPASAPGRTTSWRAGTPAGRSPRRSGPARPAKRSERHRPASTRRPVRSSP